MCGNDDEKWLSMKKKFEKYWGKIEKFDMMLLVAIVLNPRYKMKCVEFWFKQWYDRNQAEKMLAKVRDALDGLYGHYAGDSSNGGVSGKSSSEPQQPTPIVDTSVQHEGMRFLNSMLLLIWQKRIVCSVRYLLDRCEDPL
jgi:hypothetical protein